jgi:hypothetical protein
MNAATGPHQATAVMDAAGVPLFAAAMLDPGEAIIGMWRPSLWYIPLRCARIVTGLVLAALAAAAASSAHELGWTGAIVQCAGLLIALRIGWVMLDWSSRIYILTDRRVLRRRGVINPTVYQVELRQLLRVDLVQSAPARLVGIGTVTFSSRSQGMYDAAWVLAPRAAELRDLVIETKRRYRR